MWRVTWRVMCAGLLVLAACGRGRFDALVDGGATSDTAPTDAPPDASSVRTPAFVQVVGDRNDALQTLTSPSISVTAGNLVVAMVAYQTTARTLASVTDTAGNAYATAPAGTSGSLNFGSTFSYAIANASGPMTVTAMLDATATSIEIRVAEYTNIDPNEPFDTVAWGTDDSGTETDGARTADFVTTRPNELVVSLVLFSGIMQSTGTDFTARSNLFGDVLQDRIATTPGTYAGFATVNGPWLSGAAAFFAASE